jgi:hypothetical protein
LPGEVVGTDPPRPAAAILGERDFHTVAASRRLVHEGFLAVAANGGAKNCNERPQRRRGGPAAPAASDGCRAKTGDADIAASNG